MSEQVATSNAGTAPAEPPVLLEVEAVGVRLSGQKILDGISFVISEGERVGLIGPNGAGKTSLLEAVAGFAPLDAGQLRWRGAPLGAHDRKESIFYLPDGIRPCPDHRAGELVELFRVAYGQPRSRAEDVGSLFDRLRGEGRTLLLSIHELSLAERLCESFLLLAEGRLLATGRLADLRRQAGIEAGGLDRVFFALT